MYFKPKSIGQNAYQEKADELIKQGMSPGVAMLLSMRTAGHSSPFPDDPEYDPAKLSAAALKKGQTIYQAVGAYIDLKRKEAEKKGRSFEFSGNAMNTMAYQMAVCQLTQKIAAGERVEIPEVPAARKDKIRENDSPEKVLACLGHRIPKNLQQALNNLQSSLQQGICDPKDIKVKKSQLLKKEQLSAQIVIDAFRSGDSEKASKILQEAITEVGVGKGQKSNRLNAENRYMRYNGEATRSFWAKINKEVDPVDLAVALSEAVVKEGSGTKAERNKMLWAHKALQRCLWKCKHWGDREENIRRLAESKLTVPTLWGQINSWLDGEEAPTMSAPKPACYVYDAGRAATLMRTKGKEGKVGTPAEALEKALKNGQIEGIRACLHCLPITKEEWKKALTKKTIAGLQHRVRLWLSKRLEPTCPEGSIALLENLEYRKTIETRRGIIEKMKPEDLKEALLTMS
jgi:hypothetical protein